jgi:tetratricopeptide (TPR) repeat protein
MGAVRKIPAVRFFLLSALFFPAVLRAGEPPAPVEPDLGALCLRLATVQEPDADVKAMRTALDALVAAAHAALQGASSPRERVARLNEVLLKGRRVSYLSNKYWRDSTLAASVLRGRGNCLSTSTLYAVVGQRLGLPLRAVLVPKHAFARWDDGTERINIETTTGGVEAPDADYHDRTPWNQGDSEALGYGQSLSSRRFAAVLVRYAASHLSQTRRRPEALALQEEAISLWPENPSLALDRALILYETEGRMQEALAGMDALFRSCRSPEVRTRALLGIAGHLQALTRHPEALDLLRLAFQIAPRHVQPAVLSSMASSYRTLRRFDEALLTQELSTSMDGDAEDYTSLAIFYKNANRLEDAVRCLRKSSEMNPEDWNTRLILAGYMIRAGKEEEGWKVFATVEKPPVGEDFFYTNLAWFYGSVGRKKEFLESLEKALALATTPAILDYVATEVDFDRYREDADFRALLERHRKRLLGGK